MDKSRSSSSSIFYFFNRKGNGILDDLEGWKKAGDQGVSSFCTMFASSPLGPYFSIVPLVWSKVVAGIELEKGGHGKDLGELFVYSLMMLVKHFPCPLHVEFLFEHEVRKIILKLAFDEPALFRRPLNVGFITSEIEEMFMDGDGSLVSDIH
ncbi:hypothetical protein Tco_0843648 [Tanacetum coccineum]|uniref:Uncharacterized protein n=1 Tax=Tanacetum coccineum TaxID=301880 RepID=A0ABQ5B2R5_9ASTR